MRRHAIMIRMACASLLLAAGLLLPVLSYSVAAASETETGNGVQEDVSGLIDELVIASGLDVSLNEAVDLLKEGAAKNKNTLSALGRSRFDETMAEKFAMPRIMALLKDSLYGNKDKEKLQAALDWFRSDVGRKIIDAEKYLSTPEGRKRREHYLAYEPVYPTSADRLTLLYELDRLSGSSEFAQQMLNEIQAAFSSNMAFYRPGQARQDKIAATTADAKSRVKQRGILTMTLMYHEISDEELAQGVAFMRTDAGQYWKDAGLRAMKIVQIDLNKKYLEMIME
ncbi:MAG: hypothetical protein WDO70_10550 [Alphaproteobacteria bacterium]